MAAEQHARTTALLQWQHANLDARDAIGLQNLHPSRFELETFRGRIACEANVITNYTMGADDKARKTRRCVPAALELNNRLRAQCDLQHGHVLRSPNTTPFAARYREANVMIANPTMGALMSSVRLECQQHDFNSA
jgi:hypothetical protein